MTGESINTGVIIACDSGMSESCNVFTEQSERNLMNQTDITYIVVLRFMLDTNVNEPIHYLYLA